MSYHLNTVGLPGVHRGDTIASTKKPRSDSRYETHFPDGRREVASSLCVGNPGNLSIQKVLRPLPKKHFAMNERKSSKPGKRQCLNFVLGQPSNPPRVGCWALAVASSNWPSGGGEAIPERVLRRSRHHKLNICRLVPGHQLLYPYGSARSSRQRRDRWRAKTEGQDVRGPHRGLEALIFLREGTSRALHPAPGLDQVDAMEKMSTSFSSW